MDVDAIPLGANFSKVLHEEVAKCGVLLAMIGPNWLDARDEHGNRRLDDPNDLVRIEIAAALQRNIPVIPILLDGARMPKANQLPEDLKEPALRNGMEIRHASFQDDMSRLIHDLKGQVNTSSQQITLMEAAQIVYEETEETIFSKIAARPKNTPNVALVEIANTIFHRIPAYGARPPSRNRKLIDQETKESMVVFDDGNSAGYAGEINPRYVNLAVQQGDLPQCVEYIRRISATEL